MTPTTTMISITATTTTTEAAATIDTRLAKSALDRFCTTRLHDGFHNGQLDLHDRLEALAGPQEAHVLDVPEDLLHLNHPLCHSRVPTTTQPSGFAEPGVHDNDNVRTHPWLQATIRLDPSRCCWPKSATQQP